MEKLKKFGKYTMRHLNSAKIKEDIKEATESEDCNFVTDFKEEVCSIIWCIENLHQCTLKYGEYVESPDFSIMFCDEIKWSLKFYPRGRKRDDLDLDDIELLAGMCRLDTVGLFLNKISANPITSSFNCHFSYKRDLLNSKATYSAKTGVIDIDKDSTSSSEYGIDDLGYLEDFLSPQKLRIKCEFYATNAYNKGAIGNFMPGPLKYCSLYKDLKEMYENGKFSDITLQAKDKQFSAHKAILASRSEVFEAMFKHNMKESQTNVVDLEDMEPVVLSNMLHYIYTGNVDDFHIEKAIALYPAADKYFLEELKKWCVVVILDNLAVENVCQVAVLAELHPHPKLKKATFNMFRNYTGEIFRRKEWQDLVKDSDRRALVSNILQAVSADFTTSFP